MPDDVIQLFTPQEAAKVLRVSVRTVYSLIAAGHLQACRIGCGQGVLRIHCDDLQAFIHQRRGLDRRPLAERPPLGA
jgi:excisionase family DNA binding protein